MSRGLKLEDRGHSRYIPYMKKKDNPCLKNSGLHKGENMQGRRVKNPDKDKEV